MANAAIHQSQQRDAEEDTRRELEPGAAAANGEPSDHTEADTGNGLADAIALRRLLAVATLTPAQAGLLAVDLVDALVTLEERGECPDQVNDRSVLVRRDGTVAIAPTADAANGTGSTTSTATTDDFGANGTASESEPESDEDSGGSDTGGSANGGTGTNGRTNGGERLPVAATTANSLVRQLVVHTRGGSARRKVDAALLTDRLAGGCAELTELRDKVRSAVAELAAGDDAGWDDWTATTRRQVVALVTATEGRTALRDTTPISGSTPQSESPGSGVAAGGLVAGAAGGDSASPADGSSAGSPAPASSSGNTLALARGDLRGARRKAWHRKRRLPGRKTVVITLIAAMVAVAGWWAVPRAWSELHRGWEAVFTTGQPSQQLPPVSPPKDESSGGKAPGSDTQASDDDEPGQVPRLAPKAAGPINGVTIERAEGGCTGGRMCPVRVDVLLDPSASAREISWSLRIVDRCTDDIRKREGVTMTAEPWWQQVYGISRPALPDSRALAIVAVTNTPAKAASAPLLVSANRATC
ncbi:MAG: hypothetical protein GEV04_21455 [Actinophytocola sp.]|nr:hypothetical protein [Actinophytocola sp.]